MRLMVRVAAFFCVASLVPVPLTFMLAMWVDGQPLWVGLAAVLVSIVVGYCWTVLVVIMMFDWLGGRRGLRH